MKTVIKYDAQAQAAYVYLRTWRRKTRIKKLVKPHPERDVYLEIDRKGRVIGIEIL